MKFLHTVSLKDNAIMLDLMAGEPQKVVRYFFSGQLED
jgi:hypothetical protein